MKIKESKCVTLKRMGSDYVLKLLSGKSEEEELEFWATRTKRLCLVKNQKVKIN